MQTPDSESRTESDTLRTHYRCPNCNYDLYGIRGEPIRCPECGREFAREQLALDKAGLRKREWRAYVVSSLAGLTIWVLFSLYSQGSEVWDSTVYWTLGVPAVLVASAVLGYVWGDRPWRWSCTVVATQCIPIFLPGLWQGFAPLLPVGICFAVGLCILAAPFAYAGSAARMLRR